MAVMTICNIDETIKTRLRIRAAQHGRSMEEEARDILRAALSLEEGPPADLGAAIHARFGDLGGVELEAPQREPIREPASFEA